MSNHRQNAATEPTVDGHFENLNLPAGFHIDFPREVTGSDCFRHRRDRPYLGRQVSSQTVDIGSKSFPCALNTFDNSLATKNTGAAQRRQNHLTVAVMRSLTLLFRLLY